MCTSFSYNNQNKDHFLARTMDFTFELDGHPIAIPRGYQFSLSTGYALNTKFGFIGAGRKLDEYFFADGVNEKGVAIAELYFPNEAYYQPKTDPEKLNLAPHEFINWVLGTIESIEDLRVKIKNISLIEQENALLHKVVPLHFIITDQTGETVTVEPMHEGILIKDNPVSVMTNSPELEWHLKNLNNYLTLQPDGYNSRRWGDVKISPFGQGSGTFGLPGGYTPPERFVRAAFLKQYLAYTENDQQLLSGIFTILGNVTIPKGVNLNPDGGSDYTQYQAVMDVANLAYYMKPYGTNMITKVTLSQDLLTKNQPTEFSNPSGLAIEELN